MAVGFRWRWPALSRRRLSPACCGPVSPPRSSNRTCGFPASGSPTGFTARHTADGQVRLVSRDDTVARDQPSPRGRASAEASGCFVVLPGSSLITDPQPLRKRARSQGPFLRRRYPASQVVRPCPTPARPAVLATTLELRPPTGTGLPRVPGPPSQRAVPITPVDRNGCMGRLLPHSTRPSPTDRRVGIHDFTDPRPAQASLALRPTGSPDRSKRSLSRGFETVSYPTAPLVSYQINRQLSGWHLPPLVFRAFGAHCPVLAQAV